MALEGSLKDFGLADILQLIYFQRKTGILTVEGRMDRIRILFYEGNIVLAESKKRIEANRLGKVLVKKGLLTDEDLHKALDEQKSSGIKLGNILVKNGLIQKDQIQGIITSQISETVVQLFGWKEGVYEFSPQGVPLDKEIPISLDTQHLLMEGLRIIDEWSLIEGKITLDTIFEKREKPDLELTSDEEEMLRLVDGESDVSTIIDISQMDSFQASKALVSLLEKGAVEPKEVAPVIALPEIKPVRAKKRLSFSNLIITTIFLGSVLISIISLSLLKNDIRRLRVSEDIYRIRFMAEAYKYVNGFYPLSIKEITEGTDRWKMPYIYTAEDDNLTLYSSGPDGKDGTEDDIR